MRLDFCIDKCRCHSYLTGRKLINSDYSNDIAEPV